MPGAPLSYYFGHLSPSENVKLYKLLISNMARDINKKFEKNEKGRNFHEISRKIPGKRSKKTIKLCGLFERFSWIFFQEFFPGFFQIFLDFCEFSWKFLIF